MAGVSKLLSLQEVLCQVSVIWHMGLSTGIKVFAGGADLNTPVPHIILPTMPIHLL